MRGLYLRVYVPVLLFLVLKLRCVTPSAPDLSFNDGCTDKHGKFIAHPLECSKFIRCSHEKAYVFQCPTTLIWNQAIKACDWVKRTKCLLDGVTDVDARIGNMKKKSVKRDTSLHTDIYQSSPGPTMFSSTTDFLSPSEGLGSHGTKEVWDISTTISKPIDDVLLTTLKSILKTPCSKNSHITDVKSESVPSTTNNLTDYVTISESTHSISIGNETSTEADNLENTIFNNTTNSNDALTDLSTQDPNANLIATGLLLSTVNEITVNKDESLSLTESSFVKALEDYNPSTNTLTVLTTQQPFENITTSELPDISSELHSEISTKISSVAIPVLESTLVGEHDETSLIENHNETVSKLSHEAFNAEFRSTNSDVELTEDGNIEFVFTSVVPESETEHDLGTTEASTEAATENGNTMLTESVVVIEQNVTDINLEINERGNTESEPTSVVTETQTNPDLEAIESTTMLLKSVVVTEEKVKGIYLVLTEDGNIETVHTSVATETQTQDDFETSEFATEKGNAILIESVAVTEEKVMDINVVLPDGDNTELILPSVVIEHGTEHNLGKTETTTENGNTMLTESVVVTEKNVKGINFVLTEDDNTESVPTSVITEPQTEHYLETRESRTENGNTMLTEAVGMTEHNVTGINTTEDDNSAFIFTMTITEPQNELYVETTEYAIEDFIATLAHSVDTMEQTVMDMNFELTEDGNTELIFTTVVTETQDEHYLETTERDNSVEITAHADNLTELPPNFETNIKIAGDSLETPREITSEDIETLTYKPITVITEVLTELYTDTPDDLTETLTTLDTETETTLFSSENLNDTSTFPIPKKNTIYSHKLTDWTLNENALTTSALQETENTELLTETSRDAAEELTETSTNVVKIINDYFSEPIQNTTLITERLDGENIIITLTDNLHDEYTTISSVKPTDVTVQENVMANFIHDEIKIMNNISTEINTELTENITGFKTTNRGLDTESTTYTVTGTETSTDEGVVTTLTDNDIADVFRTQEDFTVIISTNLTETAAVNFGDIANTTPGNSLTDTKVLSRTTYRESHQEATEDDDFKSYSLTISVTAKIDSSTPVTDDPVTDTSATATILNLNSDAYIMFSTTTVVPSTVITDSITFTQPPFEEIVDFTEKQKDNDELISETFQERLLEVKPTANAMLLSLVNNQMSSDEDVNTNLISTTVLTSTALDPSLDDGDLSKEILDISTTVDPRLPFRSPKCKGDNNNRQFKASKCFQYYQCFAGWAFLLNCYEGYLFVTQEGTCIQDINRECNE